MKSIGNEWEELLLSKMGTSIKMSSTNKFFNKKRAWSIAKDELLKHYLNAYLVKLFYTEKPTIYLDCFAGAGKFGEEDTPYEEKIDGSPLIALEAIHNAAATSSVPNPARLACFIEPCYPEILKSNIEKSKYPDEHYKLLAGSFPEEAFIFLDDVFKKWPSLNLFCYLDPFGVKYLKMETLLKLKQHPFKSIEFLINFNSFGFFRYACGAWEIKIREDEIACPGEIAEREPMEEFGNGERLSIFDEILGTNEWRAIIENYRDQLINGYEAESRIAALYKIQLKHRLGFRYVLSIPIRLNESHQPKYRMVYATNHQDGALIMGRVMIGRQDYLFDKYCISNNGCLDLFEREDLCQTRAVDECIIEFLRGKGEVGGNAFYAGFYDEYFLTKQLRNALEKLEKSSCITIRRKPALKKSGTPRAFYTEAKGQHLFISLNE